MTSKSTWKSLERVIAKRLGLVRSANTGRACADVRGEIRLRSGAAISGECRLRASLPEVIKQALNQADANAVRGEIPCAFIKKKRACYDDTVVCMKLSDFEKLLK